MSTTLPSSQDYKSTRTAIILNAICMQILWFAAVLGAAKEAIAWAPLGFILLAGSALITARNVQADVRMAFVGLLVAFTFEPVWLGANLVLYAQGSGSWFPPVWIMLLWAGLGISCNHSLLWLKRHLGWASILGAIAAVCSIQAAMRLGALEMPSGVLKFSLIYGLCWSFILPGMAWLAGGRTSDEPTSEH